MSETTGQKPIDLTLYDIDVIRYLGGENPTSVFKGAALWQTMEHLHKQGFINIFTGELTEKGRKTYEFYKTH